MEINEYILRIKKLNACEEAVKDAHNYKTSQDLWANCKRGDWMLWLIGKLTGEPERDKRKKLALIACKCARLSLPYAGRNAEVCLKTIETAENCVNGIATIKEVKSARYAASAAASAAAYTADSAAAYAADSADSAAADSAAASAAAYAATSAAASAAASASAAAYAADSAAASAAYAAASVAASAASAFVAYAPLQCADIVRADYPNVDDLWN